MTEQLPMELMGSQANQTHLINGQCVPSEVEFLDSCQCIKSAAIAYAQVAACDTRIDCKTMPETSREPRINHPRTYPNLQAAQHFPAAGTPLNIATPLNKPGQTTSAPHPTRLCSRSLSNPLEKRIRLPASRPVLTAFFKIVRLRQWLAALGCI
jgi:hypothetical protein